MNHSLWLTSLFRSLFVGVWSTNWPLILLPIVACFTADRLSSQLKRSRIHDTRKHALALLLMASPGLVFVSLGVYAFAALRRAEVDSALCVMVFVVPVLIFTIGLFRASFLWFRSQRSVRQLVGQTEEPGVEIRELGSCLDLTVRILPTESMACMTLGVMRPVVVLSSGAADGLSLAELKAVLLHEQIHVRNRDTLWASIGKFIADCAFARTASSADLARRTREIRADQEASREADRLLLASVLIKFARHAPADSYAFAESFATASMISERVEHLLNDRHVESKQDVRLLAVKIAFACILVWYPYVVRLIAVEWLHC